MPATPQTQRTCHYITFSHILRILGVLFHHQNVGLFLFFLFLFFWIFPQKVEAFIKYFVLKWKTVYGHAFTEKGVRGNTCEIKAPYNFHLFCSVLQCILKKKNYHQ